MKRPSALVSLVTAAALAWVMTAAAWGQSPEARAYTGIQVTNLVNPVNPTDFPPIQNGFAAPPFDFLIECFVTARQFGALLTENNSNVNATLGGQTLNLSVGSMIGNLPQKTNPIGPAGVGRFSWGSQSFNLGGDELAVGVFIEGSLGGSVNGGVDQVTTKCIASNSTKCAKSGTQGCLLPSGRFSTYMLTPNGTRANVTSNPAGSNSATFSFNGSATVNLINSCAEGGNNHFQVQVVSGTGTNSTIVVEDTKSGEVVSYPANKSMTDPAAFPTCPP